MMLWVSCCVVSESTLRLADNLLLVSRVWWSWSSVLCGCGLCSGTQSSAVQWHWSKARVGLFRPWSMGGWLCAVKLVQLQLPNSPLTLVRNGGSNTT